MSVFVGPGMWRLAPSIWQACRLQAVGMSHQRVYFVVLSCDSACAARSTLCDHAGRVLTCGAAMPVVRGQMCLSVSGYLIRCLFASRKQVICLQEQVPINVAPSFEWKCCCMQLYPPLASAPLAPASATDCTGQPVLLVWVPACAPELRPQCAPCTW